MALREVDAPAPEVEERSDEAPGTGGAPAGRAPDPEVAAKPKRRQFSAEYRLRILDEADRCTRPGEIDRLLRREGLYSSHLSVWRKARRNGSLKALTPKKRGAKPAESNPLSPKIRQLEAKVTRLEKELATAHTIIDVQGNAPRPPRPSWCERNSEARVDYRLAGGSGRRLIGGFLPRRETWSRDSSGPEFGALDAGARLGN